MTTKEILFFHSVDDENRNAQSNNTKEILARWSSVNYKAVALYYNAPDPRVRANENVRLVKLPANRLWKLYIFFISLKRYAAIFYPGLAPKYDNFIRKVRQTLRYSDAVISTLEGVPVNVASQHLDEKRLSALIGHDVKGQGLKPNAIKAIFEMKNNSDRLIVISPFLEKIARHLWPTVSTTVNPLGVNSERFHNSGRIPHGQNSRVQVVCAGSCQTHKRPEVFLSLATQYPDVDFIWYGDGALRAKLRSEVESLELGNISFPGSVSSDQLADAFRKADIFVMPSIAEGVPKVTQEAAACGLPIVCMHYYEPFSVIHGQNGFQATNDESFYHCIDRLIMDSKLRAQMGKASAEMAKEWDWDLIATRWQETIIDVVTQKTGSSS